ncbi:MAG: sodium:solute symporter family transporter, partial [Terriglobales bacterium]
GWSSIISQDIIGPLRRERGLPELSSQAQIRVNRVANVFVSVFILWWSLWYTIKGPMYLYLNLTATIFLSGTFAAVIGGLYWKRANLTGGYAAMIAGAAGTVGYFFLDLPATYSGFVAFGLAAVAMVVGTWLGAGRGRRRKEGAYA